MNPEYQRQWIHISCILFAFLLRFVSPLLSTLFAFLAFLFNLYILPKLAPHIIRKQEKTILQNGVLLYPLVVSLLIFLYGVLGLKVYVAAGAWAIMAVGDGFSTIIGKKWGKTSLPWNQNKSYLGTITFFITGTIACISLMAWNKANLSFSFLFWASFITALSCAFVESLPSKWNDNIRVPLLAGALLYLLSSIVPEAWLEIFSLKWILIALIVNLVVAFGTYYFDIVDRSAIVPGIIIGGGILFFLHWSGYIILILFFILSTFATKFGYLKKAQMGIAQEKGGRRGGINAWANCSTGLILAALAVLTENTYILSIGFVAAFATAVADTTASELGPLYGKHTFLPTNLKLVAPGTEGAISFEGTLLGICSATILTSFGVIFNLIPIFSIYIIIIAAILGSLAESYLAAIPSCVKVLNNEALNFLNTLIGALIAIIAVIIQNCSYLG